MLLFTWIPAGLAIIADLLLLKYPITDKQMKQIEIELEERKAAKANGGPLTIARYNFKFHHAGIFIRSRPRGIRL